MGLLLYQQSLGLDTGLRRWHFHIIPSTRVIPIPASFGDNPEDVRYSIAPNPTTKHLWGPTLVVGTEGATSQGIVEGYSEKRPHIVSFLADGVEDEFLFGDGYAGHADFATKMLVYVAGVLRTANLTKSATSVLFTSSIPTSGQDIDVVYELAD